MTGAIRMTSGLAINWNADAGISRKGAASLAIGNGTAGDVSGTLTAAQFSISNGTQTCTINETGGNGRLGFSTGGNNQLAIMSSLLIDMDINSVLGWDSHATGTLGYTADTGISRLGAASLAIGNGTAGNTTGILTLKEIVLSDFGSAPTSAGTAGTQGQVVTHGGILYFCSATGAAGSATWNKLNMTAV